VLSGLCALRGTVCQCVTVGVGFCRVAWDSLHMCKCEGLGDRDEREERRMLWLIPHRAHPLGVNPFCAGCYL
jgi:hypothetical protein